MTTAYFSVFLLFLPPNQQLQSTEVKVQKSRKTTAAVAAAAAAALVVTAYFYTVTK